MIYHYTGNPFVDNGIWAICQWTGKKNPDELEIEDIMECVSDIVPIYLTESWRKTLFSVFPNSPKDENRDPFDRLRYLN